MPVSSLVVGVDLLPIKSIPGVVSFQADIMSQKCRTRLTRETKGQKIDVVIHDGAPNVGGATWSKDAYGQIELVLHSLRLAIEFLRPGGIFLTKVFRSQDYNALLYVLKQFFKKIDVTKPTASRDTSAEIYVYCADFLNPKKIDPRLLDPAFVFKQIETSESKAPLELRSKKTSGKQRHREGYDTESSILYKETSVADFIDSNTPVEMLGIYNTFVCDPRKDERVEALSGARGHNGGNSGSVLGPARVGPSGISSDS